jgi:hypothetical protein
MVGISNTHMNCEHSSVTTVVTTVQNTALVVETLALRHETMLVNSSTEDYMTGTYDAVVVSVVMSQAVSVVKSQTLLLVVNS